MKQTKIRLWNAMLFSADNEDNISDITKKGRVNPFRDSI
jgi:hypothetical protein